MDSMTFVSGFFGSVLALIIFVQHIRAKRKSRKLAKHGLEAGSLLPGEKHVVYAGQPEDELSEQIEYNPATGLMMLTGGFDTGGNAYGTNNSNMNHTGLD